MATPHPIQSTPLSPGEIVATADRRLVLADMPWAHYEVYAALRGEKSVPRLAYLEGVLELMSPSRNRERIRAYLGHLVVAYALERNVQLSPYGSWTLKSGPKQAGAEPDECFIFGADQAKELPDLVIEVIWTHGGIDKLEIYRRLGIREVWLCEDGRIDVYALRDGAYVAQPRSPLLQDLDLALLCSMFEQPTVTDAVRAFRDALAARA
jgi:Uma2 family endonuclease